MNRKKFQEWLEQFPEETIIEVQIQQEAHPYQSYGSCIATEFKDNDLEMFEFVDFTNNQFVKINEPYFGKKILTLGTQR
jgi:hypothetical protein